MGGGIPQAQSPVSNAALDNQVKAQSDQAKKLRETADSRANAQYDVLADQARRGVGQGIKDVRSQASSRGLLYSGLRQGAEQGVRAQGASDLANARTAVNRQVEDETYDAEQQALQGLMAQRQMQLGDAQQRYQQGLLGMKAKEGANSSLFGLPGLFNGVFG